MKINALNYVDVAESVILALKNENNGRLALTTSKIRGLLHDCKHLHGCAAKP